MVEEPAGSLDLCEDRRMSTSHQNLVFVETETQTDYLVHNLPAYTLAIAVTPIAEYLLSRSNVPFRPIDDFYQETELLALGTDCFRSTVEMISEIHEVIKDEGFTGPPFDWLNYFDFLYYIKCLRDGILNAAYRVTRVLESLEPAKVYGFAPDQVSQNVRFLSETEAVVWS
jgi:hypothetical protein